GRLFLKEVGIMRASESDFYRDVGGNLRLARELAGKSQTAVAKYLNVSFQQIQKYENGSNRIPMDKFIALSDYLRVSPTALLQGHAAQGANDAESASFFDQMQDREFRELLG